MGAKNQNPKKSLGLQTNPPINPWTKKLPPPPKKKKKEKKKKETQTVNIKTAAKQVWLYFINFVEKKSESLEIRSIPSGI